MAAVMPEQRRKLQTWQEIADYLGQGVRATQNQEKTAGLPVHRLAGLARGRVWAYTDELDAWQSKPASVQTTSPAVVGISNGAGGPIPITPATQLSPLGGHWRIAFLASGLYALLYGQAIVLELAYRFEFLGRKALVIASLVFGWVFATFLSGLVAGLRRTADGRTGGLAISASISFASVVVLQLALLRALPSAGITEQTGRQPWPPHAAYLKNVVLYFLPLATFYILLPFHLVLALQRELRANEHDRVLALLTGERTAAAPEATMYPRVRWLAVTLFAAALLSVVMTQDLFDHLKPNPNKNLFMQLALGRTLLLFGTALLCLRWYSTALNEIKAGVCARWNTRQPRYRWLINLATSAWSNEFAAFRMIVQSRLAFRLDGHQIDASGKSRSALCQEPIATSEFDFRPKEMVNTMQVHASGTSASSAVRLG
jgi:hypothetical protein